ncbi:MAG: CTP synthase [archaeon]
MSKFIFVAGGVISCVGKGVATSSIAALLESHGFTVTVMKIDPYINVDAGTMRPTEHGEVYVTEDGFETDQDLGNYERFTNVLLSKNSSLTTGQVYLEVIKREREGLFEGKCVEVIPHIPLEIIRRFKELEKTSKADFVLIEIGGTVGEYQAFPFIEAIRIMQNNGCKTAVFMVGYLPIPSTVGELKSKPLQRAIYDLLSHGVKPDFIIGRSEKPLDNERIEKIALNCSVNSEHVISGYDVDCLYKVPVMFKEQDLDAKLLRHFNLQSKNPYALQDWMKLVDKINLMQEEVKIGVIGKYFDIGDFSLEDSYISVIEAVKHAGWHNNVKPKIVWVDSKDFEKNPEKVSSLKELDGIIIPGGFGSSGVEGKILAINFARENKIPFLGLCYGMQLAVVEFARNVLSLKNASSTEFNSKTSDPVIDILPEQKKNLDAKNFGASMRLGAYEAKLKEGTMVRELYGEELISERHRHRWEVNNDYLQKLENAGLIISGVNPEKNLVEFIELPKEKHPYFVATQSHPCFKSKFFKPSPLFDGLIKAAKEKV